MDAFPEPVYGAEGQLDAAAWLRRTIQQWGHVLNENVIKVDNFVNHQVEPRLMNALGREIANRFKDAGITKVLTLEVSGIAPAFAASTALNVPMIFGRTKPSLTTTPEDYHTATTYSFTKRCDQRIFVKRNLIGPQDKVLIVDDIIAHGEATLALCDIIRRAEAECVGVGAILEKSFQPGRQKLEDAGLRVESLARIKSMNPDTQHIEFILE
eukprot:Protomagalhaensia_wolfi_Nauph_80__3615@NODE_3651_length_744_cov_332_753191_g2875_i0_p1_GENE_NODE_3651_length_744_cov_332_753191_g2875_i0NODE_3651_length_744_cov_332_753191_g2875_i0_p1_ORF_typecomplete_len212_score42_88Pribosyltran/PF00156_27/7_2e16Pribosyl_synth/PF14572_6/6_9e02Pribosyl_synth/PF14572_6/0_7_NODE_3651_length_744_cov_332_753191_g2875_i034669